MKRNFLNSWKSKNKQSDKVYIYMRIGKLTVFEFYMDISTKDFRLMIMNLGYEGKS